MVVMVVLMTKTYTDVWNVRNVLCIFVVFVKLHAQTFCGQLKANTCTG